MASTSFPLSNNPTGGRRFSAVTPPARHGFRLSASGGGRCHAIILETESLYEVLGVGAGATCKEITRAYRNRARVLHPDVAPDGCGDEFMRLRAAYATLSDPAARAVYDRSINPASRRLTRRTRTRTWTWETDQCW